MAQSLSPLDRKPPALRNRQSTLLSAAKAGIQGGFAVLGYRGRTWRIKFRGTEQVVRGENNKALPELPIVIIGIAEGISKQYYEKSYSEGDDAAPDCFSVDGVRPDAQAQRKQNELCATCRHNQWGSRITEAGKRAKSCQDMRRLAVVPVGDLQNEGFGGPMMLRIPPMSLNNLAQYADFLGRKGTSFEYVATRISLDDTVAYPRIMFEAIDYLDDAQLDMVIGQDGVSGLCADPLIGRILGATPEAVAAVGGTPTPNPAPAEPGDDEGEAEEDEAEDEGEGEEEVEEPTPPPTQPAARPANPFVTATAPKPPPIVVGAPKKVTRGVKAAATKKPTNGSVEPAPTNMESAIHNLLGE